jgi:hypothetical protein
VVACPQLSGVVAATLAKIDGALGDPAAAHSVRKLRHLKLRYAKGLLGS